MGLNLGDLQLTSSAFEDGDQIPTEHAGDGEDVSPPLEWREVPEGTREFALVCHDPDAPLVRGFTHWVVYGIPGDVTGIPRGGGGQYTEGQNDFGNRGYNGPAPPEEHGTHRYYFHLFALDAELGAAAGLTRLELLERIEGRVLEQARLVGTYEL
ncbi:MAG TPA: YbhB/YbcL family Raf kinase inhibitor-like protein [Nitriliruptorales bacterium]|nr:YbhB/YbcL family Raf kinase inhibitor-like protein [Nitriliruptorales bacterium]